MTTQKAQSKIKTSTIAITILSVLLAVAVASTIVLAAFSATKTATTTTITFGGGMQLTLEAGASDDFDANFAGDTLTITPKDSKTFTSSVTIPAIKASVNMDAYIAYKVAVTVTDRASGNVAMTYTSATKTFASGYLGSSTDTLKVVVTPSTDFAAGTGDGVFNNTAASTAFVASDTAANIIDAIIISVDNNNYSAVAGYSVTVDITFFAGDAETEKDNVAAHSFA